MQAWNGKGPLQSARNGPRSGSFHMQLNETSFVEVLFLALTAPGQDPMKQGGALIGLSPTMHCPVSYNRWPLSSAHAYIAPDQLSGRPRESSLLPAHRPGRQSAGAPKQTASPPTRPDSPPPSVCHRPPSEEQDRTHDLKNKNPRD